MTIPEPLLTPEELAEITPWSSYRIRDAARRHIIRSHQFDAGKKGAKLGILYSEFLEDTEQGISAARDFERRVAERARRLA